MGASGGGASTKCTGVYKNVQEWVRSTERKGVYTRSITGMYWTVSKTYTSNTERTYMSITCRCTGIRRECERGHMCRKMQEGKSRNVTLVHLGKEAAPEKTGIAVNACEVVLFTRKVQLLRLLKSNLKEMNNYRNKDSSGI